MMMTMMMMFGNFKPILMGFLLLKKF